MKEVRLRESRSWRPSPALLGTGAFAVSVLMILRAVQSAPSGPSAVELILFQVLVFFFGLWASFEFAKQSAENAAKDLIRPHANSAFRRVVSLYSAFQRLGSSIEARREVLKDLASAKDEQIHFAHVQSSLDLLAAQVAEQIGTANDAAEDWRALVPEEVAEIERRADERAQGRGPHG